MMQITKNNRIDCEIEKQFMENGGVNTHIREQNQLIYN